MITMKSLITSGQIAQAGTFVADAGRKATETLLKDINENGQVGTFDVQRFFAGGARIKAAITEVVRKEILAVAMGVVGILKLISAGKKVRIAATGGKRTIAKAKKTFPGFIDSDFVNYGCDVVEESKPETSTEVYEMTDDGDFSKIFGGFGINLDLLCFTQDQIIEFVETQPDWLRKDGYGTLFLFKVNGEFFVASVRVDVGGLEVHARRFSRNCVWGGDYRHRVVVPQLALAN